MEMREKLLNLMKSEGLTSSRLAEILEIQPSGVSHILSGRNKPGFDLLQKILRRFPRINPDWLLLDSDVMFRDGVSVSEQSVSTEPHQELFSATTAPMQNTSSEKTVLSPEQANREASLRRPCEATNPNVVRVVVFYSDHTFESFHTKE